MRNDVSGARARSKKGGGRFLGGAKAARGEGDGPGHVAAQADFENQSRENSGFNRQTYTDMSILPSPKSPDPHSGRREDGTRKKKKRRGGRGLRAFLTTLLSFDRKY